mmetsp:Transcript_38776/g.76846  ORF Transcript_38776/g.76846 Transcript_38776/m.76846 type:complete len:306 (-) Transcript_38776:49-966(-)
MVVADGEASEHSAVGHFSTLSMPRLASLVGEQDEKILRRRLQEELGVCDDSFTETLLRSFSICRRGALLYAASGELAVSFNGGKDACVVLYLWLASIMATQHHETIEDVRLRVVFFDSSDEFVEVLRFVQWVVRSLKLEMVTFVQRSFKDGMSELVADGCRAMVMGQRRGDPWTANVDAFSPSSDGWPAFMRINPIIEWSYVHVWTFLRAFSLPYCSLYDEGYTSLGSVNTTVQNPALKRADGSFSPAWELQDESRERDSRKSPGGGDGGTAKRSRAEDEAVDKTLVTSSPRQLEAPPPSSEGIP